MWAERPRARGELNEENTSRGVGKKGGGRRKRGALKPRWEPNGNAQTHGSMETHP